MKMLSIVVPDIFKHNVFMQPRTETNHVWTMPRQGKGRMNIQPIPLFYLMEDNWDNKGQQSCMETGAV